MSMLLANRQGLLGCVTGNHQTEANPEIEGVP